MNYLMRLSLLALLIISVGLVSAQNAVIEIDYPLEAPKKEKKESELKSLVKNDGIKHGGYFALDFKYGEYEAQSYVLAGVRVGWVIDHSLTIGFAGYGIIPELQLSGKLDNQDVYLYGGYGGLLIEPILFPKLPVHISLPIVLGAGALTYEPNSWHSGFDNSYEENYDIFFVAEPSAQIELSVVKFVRVAAGVGYRFTNKLDLPNTKPDEFDGWNANLTLKFGSF